MAIVGNRESPMKPRMLRGNREKSVQDASPFPDTVLPPESFRQMFVALDLPPDGHPIVGVTSAIRGEGRTMVALGLAHTLAGDLAGPVTLVELDGEHPTLATLFGLPASPGLFDVLRGSEHPVEDITHRVADNLFVVPAGACGEDGIGLLCRLPGHNPFEQTVARRGAVILDLPPILAYSYTSLAASLADAVLLVVRAGVTPIEMVREAAARLDVSCPRGVVFNGASAPTGPRASGRKL